MVTVMFPFHKPKVYRSSAGCCICKAKSSSSRFTDSRKYENDFQECFQLSSPRQGEICNACVLLVKRFKRLPTGSERHWGHVVNARAGPGMKCMSKFKKKRDEMYRCEKRAKEDVEGEREGSLSEGEGSWGSDEEPVSDEEVVVRARRKPIQPTRHFRSSSHLAAGFLDSSFWKKENVCCGDVWKGPDGEIVLDMMYFKPCELHRSSANSQTAKDADTPLGKVFSDNSSDSGYDESSNPSLSSITRNVNALPNQEAICMAVDEVKSLSLQNTESVIKQHPRALLMQEEMSKQKGIVILKQKLSEVNTPDCAITTCPNAAN